MMHLRNLALSMLFGLFAADLAGAQQKQIGVIVKMSAPSVLGYFASETG